MWLNAVFSSDNGVKQTRTFDPSINDDESVLMHEVHRYSEITKIHQMKQDKLHNSSAYMLRNPLLKYD